MKIEGYELLDELNRGPITTVFRGRQTALDRPVLIKVLNAQWQKDEELVERFRREALICARLKHANIISIFDISTNSDNLYMIIEFVDGDPLDQFISKHSPLPFHIIESISSGILAGLQYAHAEGVVHRDIKPGNILISKEGRARIVDFGLARQSDFPTLTAQHGTVGTPAYMAPEQISGGETGPLSDIFSTGITLYEMITGSSPFLGSNAGESMQNILNRNLASPTEKREDIPRWFSDMVLSMLKKDPKNRPQSVQSLLQKYSFPKDQIDSASLADLVGSTVEESPTEATGISIPAGILAMVTILALAFFAAIAARQWPLSDTPVASISLQSEMPSFPDSAEDSLRVTPLPQQKPEQNLPDRVTKPAAQTAIPDRQTTPAIDTVSPPKSIAFGGLYIRCNPWGTIYINEIKYDTTPMMESIQLPSGKHLLELRNPSYETYIDTISISDGRTDSLTIDLSPLVGYLDLTVIPWAEVFLNGKYYETTPLEKEIHLARGKYLLTLRNPNFQTWQDSISIISGNTLEQKITLNP